MLKIFSFIIVASVIQRICGSPLFGRDFNNQDENFVSNLVSNIRTEQAQKGDVLLENTDPEPLTDNTILTNTQEKLLSNDVINNGINANIPSEAKLQFENLTPTANLADDAGSLNVDVQTPSIDVPPINDYNFDDTTLANEQISLPNTGIDSNRPLSYFPNPLSLINSLINEMAQERQAFRQFMFANTPFAGMRLPFPSIQMPSFKIPSPPSPSSLGMLSPSNYFTGSSSSNTNFNSLPYSVDKMQPPMELVNHDIINGEDGKLQGETKEWRSPPDPNSRSQAKMSNVNYNDDNVKAKAQSYSSSSVYSSTGLGPESTNDRLSMPRLSSFQLSPGSFAFTLPRFQYN